LSFGFCTPSAANLARRAFATRDPPNPILSNQVAAALAFTDPARRLRKTVALLIAA